MKENQRPNERGNQTQLVPLRLYPLGQPLLALALPWPHAFKQTIAIDHLVLDNCQYVQYDQTH